ncbi:MAG: carboxypeptidase regulatory-like domain-containing protein, partial [Acidobacteriota bacterium]|nr:carboxypeptidase regulatory-like domain-containing protein [Acidobacteriota bacterium]
ADGEGRPIAGATITVSERSSSYFNSFAASTTQRAFGRGETDGDGFYLIRGIDSKSEQMVVSAYHRGFAPLEETVEMRPGTNRLDLVLGQGVTLSGVVVTETGEPVGGAQIELSTISTSMGHTMSQGQQPVESGLDGSFRLGGLTAGSHRVQARKSGFAESAPQTVAADGGHEIRVTLTLRRGGTIRGRILGLEPDQLDQFELMAAGEEQMAMGVIGQDAEYRVSNVGFSEGRVIASSQSSGRMVSEAFSLDPRGGETWVDLEFGDGARLGGTVLRNGEPWPQVQVLAQSDNENFGSSTTDAGGRFRIEDLKDGLYQVMVLAMGTTSHSEAVRVAGDIEIQIDIATGRVSGRVVAEEDRRPVAGAVVMAAVDGDLPTAFLGQRTMTSTTGDFEIEVPVGVRVSLRAQAPGFAEGSIELDTSAGSEISGVELVLAGGDELELNVRLWTGASPALLSVALVDASGNRVLADALTGHPPGRFRLSSAPPGSWTLLLAADQAAVTSQTVTIPGSPVEVVLQQGATVQVQISDSIEAGDAKFRLLASNGAVLVFPAFGAVLTEIPFVASAGMIPFVPAGDWVVELIGSSGGLRRQAVTAIVGETVSVTFE